MTEERVALMELIEKSADAELVREMLSFAAGRLMEAEVRARTGAAHGVRDPGRQVRRNGYRERGWETRVGRIGLAIPKLRKGSYFPSFLEPRRTAEKALIPDGLSADRYLRPGSRGYGGDPFRHLHQHVPGIAAGMEEFWIAVPHPVAEQVRAQERPYVFHRV